MKSWWLYLTVKSDLCAASGDSVAGLIDTKVCLEHGVPVIPAKRIKGALLNEGKEMASNGFVDGGLLKRLFGAAGEACSGSLSVGDAHLYRVPGPVFEGQKDAADVFVEDYEKLQETLSGPLGFGEAWTERTLTRTRSFTAIDRTTGAAKKTSLRTVQTVPAGTVFRCRIGLDSKTEQREKEELLKYCVKALRHLGLGITRGLGEISCELTEREAVHKNVSKSGLENAPDGELLELTYELELKNPVLLSKEMSMRGGGQIPGSAIQGALAGMYLEDHELGNRAHEEETFRRIFLRDGVSFGYAYPVKDQKNFYPCPANLARVKNTDKLMNLFNPDDAEKRRKSIGSQVRWDWGNNSFLTIETGAEVRTHHARPADRAIGHALNDRVKQKDMGQFFQYTALTAEQQFRGTLKGRKEDLLLLLECLKKRGNRIRIGRSKTAEYGEISWTAKYLPEHTAAEKIKACRWLVWVCSPLVTFDETSGEIRPDAGLLAAQLSRKYGREITVENTALRFGQTGGYNSKWRLPAIQYPALSEGSAILLSSPEPWDAVSIEEERWGLLTGMGCGQLKAAPYDSVEKKIDGYRLSEYKGPEKRPEETQNPESSPLAEKLLDCYNNENERRKDIGEALRAKKPPVNMTTISALIALAECQDDNIYLYLKEYADNIPSFDKGIYAPDTEFWRLAALTSVGVRPVRLHPLPCQPPKFGVRGPAEFCSYRMRFCKALE